MKRHTRIYLKSIGAGEQSTVLCEVCNAVAVDIHHIESRGMGGRKGADTLDNLVALCRECHGKAHAGKIEGLKELAVKRINGGNANV
jgi:5-methylcytosine-specific restriction endonuclease McrA